MYLGFDGLCLGGSTTEYGKTEIALGKTFFPGDQATILGDGARISLPGAVFVNTSLAHMLDYDDTGTRPPGHPGSAIVQTALAVGEFTQTSGEQLLTAITLGYEVSLRIGEATQPSIGRKKEGPIGGWIAFGPTVVTARLLNISISETRAAIGLVGSGLEGSARSPGSSHGVRWISDKRPGLYKISMGHKALAGIIAVLRAKNGYPAPNNLLDGTFWTALGTDQIDPTRIVSTLNEEYLVQGIAFKSYPCCRYLHPVLDGVADILSREHIRTEDIQQIRIRGYRSLEPLSTIIEPKDIWEAEFSLPYTIALVATRVKPGLDWFDLKQLQDPMIRNLMERVSVEVDDSLNRVWLEERRMICKVEIQTKEGVTKSMLVDNVRGDPGNPLSSQDLVDKFMEVAGKTVGDDKGESIVNTIERLEELPKLDELFAALSP